MIWLLANWRLVAIGVLIAIPSAYAAVQKIRLEHAQAAFAQYRAEIAAASAEAEVRNTQEAAQHEKNTREVLDDLQTRNDALRARYDRLRKSAGGSVPAVPTATGTAPPPSAGPAEQPDPAARCLAILEIGDKELAKYRELWELGVKNAN